MFKYFSLLASLMVLLGFSEVFGQNFRWAKHVESLNSFYDNRIAGVSIAPNGDFVFSGNFTDTIRINFGPNPTELTSVGGRDGYIARADSNGNLLWVYQLGGPGIRGVGIHKPYLDQSGNILAGGIFGDTLDFDPGPGTIQVTPGDTWDKFLLKLSPTGNLIWVRSFGTENVEAARLIRTNSDNDIYVYGDFVDSVDFDLGVGTEIHVAAYGVEQNFVLCLDSAANLKWVGQQKSTIHGLGENDLVIDRDDNFYTFTDIDSGGNIYMDWHSSTPLSFSTASLEKTILSKYTPNGNWLWSRCLYSGNTDTWSTIMDSLGNFYTIGQFVGSVDFDPGPASYMLTSLSSAPDENTFITKHDSVGNLIWAKSIECPQNSHPRNISFGLNNNLVISGMFKQWADFDPGPGVHRINQIPPYRNTTFLLSLEHTTGNFIYAKAIEGTNYSNTVQDHESNKWGDTYVVGNFNGNTDFYSGPNTYYISATNNGGDNGFIWKHSASGCGPSNSEVVVTGCDAYTSPSGNYLWTSPGFYRDTILNQLGCDSTILFDLSLNSSPRDSLSITRCGSFIAPSGNVYHTSGIYSDTIPATFGCDSIVQIDLTIRASGYTTNITANTCQDTVINGQLFTTSGRYIQYLNASNGCDSTLYIDLTIERRNPIVTVSGDSIRIQSLPGAQYQWLRCPFFAVIPGATGRAYRPSGTGVYAVEFNVGGCLDTTACYPFQLVGQAQEFEWSELDVFPNPSDGHINISFGRVPFSGEVSFLSSSGQEVYFVNFERESQKSLHLPDLKGLYLLKFTSSDGRCVFRKVVFQ